MKPRSNYPFRGFLLALLILVLLNLIAWGWFARPLLEQGRFPMPFAQASQVDSSALAATPSPTSLLSPNPPTDTAIPVLLNTNSASAEENLLKEGVLLLAMRDGLNTHLFAYHPLYLPLTRLSNNPWDDITPALNPDGTRIAYSSRQNGYWDLYVLDLVTGRQTRLTDTPEYEAAPTWSPDGLWIAYERYNGISLDIYIQSLDDPGSDPIQLTDDPGIDRAPVWSPQGREIAFVSTRSGDEEIWLAGLDRIDDRFINISRSPLARDRLPAWSADGQRLAWASEEEGFRRLAVWDQAAPDQPAILLGEGNRVAWGPDGTALFSEVGGPNQTGLAAYTADSGRLSLPFTPLPGAVYGMTWVKGPLVGWLAGTLHHPDMTPHPALWLPALTRTVIPSGRLGLIPLEDVSAPQAMLHDAVDEAFSALRGQVSQDTGWDTLSSLENAYVALTTPFTPSLQQDWLYTGRAFALNPLLLSAGWVAITREDYGGQTYWRLYLKARYQDGSMGLPMTDMIWDLNARFTGDAKSYEQGGKLNQTPVGYWIDFTELALRYGWERVPSWINWRTFYPSIRFNQFVMTGNLGWQQAMAEIYPPEALRTPTSAPTYTPTLSRTPKAPPRSWTETPTPTLTSMPTRRPTWTPFPSQKSP